MQGVKISMTYTYQTKGHPSFDESCPRDFNTIQKVSAFSPTRQYAIILCYFTGDCIGTQTQLRETFLTQIKI